MAKPYSKDLREIVTTSHDAARNGKDIRRGLIRRVWCSLLKPGPRPTWRHCSVGHLAGSGSSPRSPYGHWNTMTFVAALRHDRIEAPWLLDGRVRQLFHKLRIRAHLISSGSRTTAPSTAGN
jgi:hypothetical protein